MKDSERVPAHLQSRERTRQEDDGVSEVPVHLPTESIPWG